MGRARRLGNRRSLETPHREHSAGPSRKSRRRRGRSELPGKPRLRLHDRPGRPRGRRSDHGQLTRLVRPDLPLPPSPEWPALTTGELVARKPAEGEFRRLRRAPISVVLEDVRSLANVGLIFRICDALRVERLYLCGITGRPADPTQAPGVDPRPRHVQDRAEREITKTAVMAIPFVPWEYRPSALEVVTALRTNGYQIVAVEQAHHST